MALNKLSARAVATAGPGKHEDGGGLRLVVSATGGKKWVLRVTTAGKRREFGLGGYPLTSLAEARHKASEIRKRIADGLDPITPGAVAAVTPSFTSCAARYIRAHRRSWSNAKHAHQWCATLKTYARPKIGAIPVDQITTEDIQRVLDPIWAKKTETAKRVQNRIENILYFASAKGWRSGDNPARWRGHLDKILACPSKVKAVKHRPAMPYAELPAFFSELSEIPGQSALALRFLILTACRTSEVLGAQWSEINQTAAVWTIPKDRMKSDREHRVPLSRQALEILQGLPRHYASPFIFPGARQARPLSNMALLQLMRGLGFGVNCHRGDYVPHGFRSSFRDWASEQTSAPHAVMEAALAHVVPDETVKAYARSDLLKKRSDLMQVWADFVYSL